MRLRDFKRVDLPHPDGPIIAVICFSGTIMSIFFSA